LNPSHVIIFLHRHVRTGGQRYMAEVLSSLKRNGVRVSPVYLDDFPTCYRKLGLAADCLACGLWLFGRVRRTVPSDDVLFFEDVYLRPRLWLFHWLFRASTRRFQRVVLVQNVLTNHRLLRHRLLRVVDRALARPFLRRADLVLTNSEFIRQHVISYGAHANRTKVVYCGFEGSVSPGPTVGTAGTLRDHLRVLFVGQCEPYKGIDVLLRAIARFDQDPFLFVLDIVGDTQINPAYYRLLLDIIEREGLRTRVTFHGHADDKTKLRAFYKHADVFVLPSRYEGFGIVLLEALSFGLPIVATRAGAIPELIQDGVCGLLVEPDNPQALAAAIGRLLRSAELRAQFGANALGFAREKQEFYTWDAVGERILTHLRALGLATTS